jgi:hypothetical protein
MRYLVRARVKPGREADLIEAIGQETLGQGSVAEGEYLRNMKDARLCGDQTARGRSLLLPHALAGRAPLLGRIFRSDSGAGCARPLQMPRRKWHRTMGLRRLRLHEAPRREVEELRHAFPRDFADFPALRSFRGQAEGLNTTDSLRVTILRFRFSVLR